MAKKTKVQLKRDKEHQAWLDAQAKLCKHRYPKESCPCCVMERYRSNPDEIIRANELYLVLDFLLGEIQNLECNIEDVNKRVPISYDPQCE